MKLKNYINLPLLALLTLLFLFACKQPSSPNSQTTAEDQTMEAQELTIDTFSTFPPEIDGCACYFSSDSTAFEKRVYLYMNDYGKISFLKINGVLTKFTQTNLKEIGEKKMIIKAKSEQYEMTLESVELKQNGDETWLKSGTIRLSDKKGKTITKSFYGECGC